MKHLRWIIRFWRPHFAWLWILLGFTLLSAAVTLFYPQVFRYMLNSLQELLDEGATTSENVNLWKYILLIAGVGLARSIANFYPGFRALVNARLEMDIRKYYFGQIITKGYKFFQRFRTGDLVTRLTDDIGGFPKIAWFCCSGIFRAVESTAKFAFCIGFMFSMNWKLTLLSIIPLPLMLWIFYKLRVEIGKRARERQDITSTTNDALEAAFSGIRILKAFRGEEHQTARFRAILDRRIKVEMSLMRLWMGIHNLYFGVQFIGQVIVIVAGGMMVINGSMKIGDFYAFYVYLSMLLQPLMDIPQLFVSSRQAFACIDREIEIEETLGGTEQAQTGTEPLPHFESIELKHIGFTYDEGLEPSLSNVSLKVERGQRAAVVGPVGSGKSTLVKVVAGLLPPTNGELLVNGQPLSTYDQAAWRAQVGYIPQEATLFSETVAENVAFGRKCTAEMVLDALTLAQVREEIEAMPEGVEQVLGQRGMTVSGGQKQRLAIARALAMNPGLLLMDDCTSALDAENERAFWQMFSARNPDAACLIVTHRISTARQADVIYVLGNGGTLVGRGTHAELLASCEEYRNFLTKEELKAAVGIEE